VSYPSGSRFFSRAEATQQKEQLSLTSCPSRKAPVSGGQRSAVRPDTPEPRCGHRAGRADGQSSPGARLVHTNHRVSAGRVSELGARMDQASTSCAAISASGLTLDMALISKREGKSA